MNSNEVFSSFIDVRDGFWKYVEDIGDEI